VTGSGTANGRLGGSQPRPVHVENLVVASCVVALERIEMWNRHLAVEVVAWRDLVRPLVALDADPPLNHHVGHVLRMAVASHAVPAGKRADHTSPPSLPEPPVKKPENLVLRTSRDVRGLDVDGTEPSPSCRAPGAGHEVGTPVPFRGGEDAEHDARGISAMSI
jgi:hypothetical protein